MHYNNIEELTRRKEIRCEDCNHSYLVRAEAISSACSKCGNLAYHPMGFSGSEANDLDSLANDLSFPASDLGFLGPVEPVENPSPDPSAKIPAESRMVDVILLQNQREWQLWSQLVQHFNDENNHQAYLTFVSFNSFWEKAVERYTQHRKTFLPIAKERWQAEIADQKLDALASICQVQMERITQDPIRPNFSDWLIQTRDSGKHLRPGFSLLFVAIGLLLGASVTISLAM